MDYLPNLHPIMVHCPIALVPTVLVLDLLAIWGMRKKAATDAGGDASGGASRSCSLCAACGGVVLVLAALGGAASVVTGLMAEEDAEALAAVDEAVHETLEAHELAGFVAGGLIVALAAWRGAMRLALPSGGARWLYLLLLLVTLAAVGAAGHFGGKLVYGHGVGVMMGSG